VKIELFTHKDLALKEAPNRRPRYFMGNEENLYPKILAKPSTLLTLSTRTNSNLRQFQNIRTNNTNDGGYGSAP